MVTSKPKRISVAAGVVHMINLLFQLIKFYITTNSHFICLFVACLYDCIMRQRFAKAAAAWY